MQEPAVWRKWLLGGLLGLWLVADGIEVLRHYLRRTPRQKFPFTYVIPPLMDLLIHFTFQTRLPIPLA
ncbi:hypothetical protein F0U61_33280 [Archangium violaceum]|uniref:hypothetical protein n=1 Tax=Archangium violaceum TaxID=83451 RepID=UPI002B2EC937|nr:hypothetical protein F0U61_33280 [Archangium violaceum]